MCGKNNNSIYQELSSNSRTDLSNLSNYDQDYEGGSED